MKLIDAYDNPIIKQALSERLKSGNSLKLPKTNFENKAIDLTNTFRNNFENNNDKILKQINVNIPNNQLTVNPQKEQSDRSILSFIGGEVRKIAAEIKNLGKSGVGDITINNTATAGDTQDLMAKMKHQTLKTLDGVLEKTMKMQYG